MRTFAEIFMLSPTGQTWLVGGIVALTLAAFAWRAWRKAHSKGAGAGSCGCGAPTCARPTTEKLRRSH